MITLISLIILAVLGFVALLDIKYKEIPSIFLTGILFMILFFNFKNLQFGVLAFVLAYLLYEGDFITGVADIKMITLVGLMISSFYIFGLFTLLLMVLGMAVKFYAKWRYKKEFEFAFIPIIFINYVILLIIGGVA